MRYKPHEVPLKFTLSFADFTLPVDFRFLLDMYDIRFHTRTSIFSFRKKKEFSNYATSRSFCQFLYPYTIPLYFASDLHILARVAHHMSNPDLKKTPLTSKWQCGSLKLEDALHPMSTTSIGPGLESQQLKFVNRILDHECVQTSATITKKDRSFTNCSVMNVLTRPTRQCIKIHPNQVGLLRLAMIDMLSRSVLELVGCAPTPQIAPQPQLNHPFIGIGVGLLLNDGIVH